MVALLLLGKELESIAGTLLGCTTLEMVGAALRRSDDVAWSEAELLCTTALGEGSARLLRGTLLETTNGPWLLPPTVTLDPLDALGEGLAPGMVLKNVGVVRAARDELVSSCTRLLCGKALGARDGWLLNAVSMSLADDVVLLNAAELGSDMLAMSKRDDAADTLGSMLDCNETDGGPGTVDDTTRGTVLDRPTMTWEDGTAKPVLEMAGALVDGAASPTELETGIATEDIIPTAVLETGAKAMLDVGLSSDMDGGGCVAVGAKGDAGDDGN